MPSPSVTSVRSHWDAPSGSARSAPVTRTVTERDRSEASTRVILSVAVPAAGFSNVWATQARPSAARATLEMPVATSKPSSVADPMTSARAIAATGPTLRGTRSSPDVTGLPELDPRTK